MGAYDSTRYFVLQTWRVGNLKPTNRARPTQRAPRTALFTRNGSSGAGCGLLEGLAARKRHTGYELVRADVGQHVADGGRGAADRGLAFGVVAARAMVGASLNEHGIAQPRPIYDGVRGCAVQVDGI